MEFNRIKLADLRPGMEHLDFKLTIVRISGVRKVKTYSGLEHSILEGEVTDNNTVIPFAVWNEKISLFDKLTPSDEVELLNCFITSFKGVLQLNVGRDSSVRREGAKAE